VRHDEAAEVPTVAEIYAQHCRFVWRNLRRLGVAPEQIEDAVQDVFLVVHRRLSEFEGRSSLATWLFGIVLRVASRYRERSRSKRQRFEPGSADFLDEIATTGSHGAFEEVAQRQAADLVYSVLDGLDEDKRNMFVMVELEQMSVVEAAQVLDLNLNTAYSRLKRASAEFERQLKRVAKQRGAGV
jgi:RNA polymerase sigma-70 factor, ECF subfamily